MAWDEVSEHVFYRQRRTAWFVVFTYWEVGGEVDGRELFEKLLCLGGEGGDVVDAVGDVLGGEGGGVRCGEDRGGEGEELHVGGSLSVHLYR